MGKMWIVPGYQKNMGLYTDDPTALDNVRYHKANELAMEI